MSNDWTKEHRAQQEMVSLYAVRALPADDARAVEAHIETCVQCRHELEKLRPVAAAFASWPTDLLRPSESLWERLSQRISGETGTTLAPALDHPMANPEWEQAAPGISCKLLSTDNERDRVSMLVRLAPGADYPPHRHGGVEELHLLDGELMIDEKKLFPGDYIRAEAHSVDQRVWSETGCTCILITSTKDELR